MKISLDQILATYKKKNYVLLESSYRLNVFGIRANTQANNKFDDLIGLVYWDYGKRWNVKFYQGTTDPGLFYLKDPINVNGTAIVVPGQYLKSHVIGLHKGKYKALVQKGPIKVYRDRDLDYIYDMDPATIDSGNDFGINIHRASESHISTQVDQWSAGCQVIANPIEYDDFMETCEIHKTNYGNEFNYTLFLETEIA
jgi:hypothetical protein